LIAQTETSNQKTCSSVQPHRWLITGGCGFIGTSLIKKLMQEGGHYIRVLDNLAVGTRKNLSSICAFTELAPDSIKPHTVENSKKSKVQLIVGDIRDDNLCKKSTRGIDIIVHLAANTGVGPSVDDPRQDMETNIYGTFNLLESAKCNKVKRFIFASSGAPIGECEPPIHEEMAPHPVSPYGASKLAGEGYCSVYYRTFGVETVCLRFSNVYGPLSGHKNSVVAKFIKRTLSGESFEIFGDGHQTRDYIYIDDLIDAIFKSSSKQVAGETFQIATNKEHTVNELVELLSSQLQQSLNLHVNIIHADARLGDVRRNYSDTTKAKNLLGWQPTFTLCEGIMLTIDWFVNQQNG
jgi:UDP-glucose 4-epimerase